MSMNFPPIHRNYIWCHLNCKKVQVVLNFLLSQTFVEAILLPPSLQNYLLLMLMMTLFFSSGASKISKPLMVFLLLPLSSSAHSYSLQGTPLTSLMSLFLAAWISFWLRCLNDRHLGSNIVVQRISIVIPVNRFLNSSNIPCRIVSKVDSKDGINVSVP